MAGGTRRATVSGMDFFDIIDAVSTLGGFELDPAVWKFLGVVALGIFLGWSSVQAWPHLVLTTQGMRMANVALSPLAMGFGVYGVLRHRAPALPAARWAGWTVVLVMALVVTRWVLAVQGG